MNAAHQGNTGDNCHDDEIGWYFTTFMGLWYSSEDFLSLSDTRFTCTLYGLEPNTTYYYCPYTYVGYMYHVGPVLSFTTPASSLK